MKNNNLAVFDLDGVILESIDCKTNAFRDLYESYGKEIQKKVVMIIVIPLPRILRIQIIMLVMVRKKIIRHKQVMEAMQFFHI